MQFKSVFGLNNVRRRTAARDFEKLPQLLHSLPQIQLVLIAIGNARARQVSPKQLNQVVVANLTLIALRIVEGVQHPVHGRSVVQRGGYVAGKVPLPFELEAQRTHFVSANGRCAQAGGKARGRRHHQPRGHIRMLQGDSLLLFRKQSILHGRCRVR